MTAAACARSRRGLCCASSRSRHDFNAATTRLQAAEQGRELARTRGGLESAADRVRRYDKVLLREAHRATAAAEGAYGSGKLGVMDLLDARRNLYATRVDAAVAQSDYAKALAAWEIAIPESRVR